MSITNQRIEEIRIAKIYETAITISDKESGAILPKGVSFSDIKKYIETQITDAQPRHLRIEGRPSFRLEDYKMPFNFFAVPSNSVGYISGMGPIFMGDGGANMSAEDTLEEGSEIEIVEEEEEDIVIDLDNNSAIPKTSNAVIEGTIIEEEEVQEEPEAMRHMFISNEKTSQRHTIPNQNVATQLNSRDYGEMIVAHLFINGRKTIDELVQELAGIDKVLLTILTHKLISEGFLQRYKDIDIDKETGKEVELDTLEIVPIKKQKMEEEAEEEAVKIGK